MSVKSVNIAIDSLIEGLYEEVERRDYALDKAIKYLNDKSMCPDGDEYDQDECLYEMDITKERCNKCWRKWLLYEKR